MSGPARRLFNKGVRPVDDAQWKAFIESLNLMLDDLTRDAQINGVYANNAAALAAGLKPGQKYRTGGNPDVVCVVD